MKSHAFSQIVGFGEDAPEKSLDLISFCFKCGTMKHSYRHNGGQRSDNYPRYYSKNYPGTQHVPPPCIDEDKGATTGTDRQEDDLGFSSFFTSEDK